jgi:hypothetical protein
MMILNIAKATPHFFMDNKAGIEIAQSAISIQLFKSCQSPFAMRVIIKKTFIAIQKAIANIAAVLLHAVWVIGSSMVN